MSSERLGTLDVGFIWLHIGETGKHFCRLCFFFNFSGWNLIFDQKLVNLLHFWWLYIFFISELKYDFWIKKCFTTHTRSISIKCSLFFIECSYQNQKVNFWGYLFWYFSAEIAFEGDIFRNICYHPEICFQCNNEVYNLLISTHLECDNHRYPPVLRWITGGYCIWIWE